MGPQGCQGGQNHCLLHDLYQGIDTSGNRNATRIRTGAGNKDETVAADIAIADAFGNRFSIPLDFELLEGHMLFYQSALGDRLEYESPSTTTAVQFRPQAMPTPHMTLKTSV